MAASAASATWISCAPLPDPTPIPPKSWPPIQIGNPPGRPVIAPSVAAAIAPRTGSGKVSEGLPVDAAVCAFARADLRESTFAPAMRNTARSTAEASTMTMHCGWPDRSAMEIAADSIEVRASSVSRRVWVVVCMACFRFDAWN